MAIKLSRYIRPECFLHDLAEKTREEALRRIIHEAASQGLIRNEEELFSRFMERESVQTTAVGNGIAIPHCFTDEISDLVIIVARAPGGLEFDSYDGKPTRVIFLLMGNQEEHSLHLKALARIARLIKSTGFIEKIISAGSVQDMVRAFDEEEAKI